MINRQDVKEIFYEEVENVHTLLKWAWKELSWEAKKQREIFVKDFQNKVNTLSDKEKQFLVDFIEEWWAEGFDFSAKSFIEREFPEKKDQLLEIVYWERISRKEGSTPWDRSYYFSRWNCCSQWVMNLFTIRY